MKKNGSIILPLLFFSFGGGYMLWKLYKGLTEGQVNSIAKMQHSTIYTRTEDPGLYWASISVLGLIGTICIALVIIVICAKLFKKK